MERFARTLTLMPYRTSSTGLGEGKLPARNGRRLNGQVNLCRMVGAMTRKTQKAGRISGCMQAAG